MVIKSFNVEEKTYKEFSEYCKSFGLSMSKQINLFMKNQLEDEPELKKSYIRRIEKARKGPFIRVEGTLRDYINQLQARDFAKNYKNTSKTRQKK